MPGNLFTIEYNVKRILDSLIILFSPILFLEYMRMTDSLSQHNGNEYLDMLHALNWLELIHTHLNLPGSERLYIRRKIKFEVRSCPLSSLGAP